MIDLIRGKIRESPFLSSWIVAVPRPSGECLSTFPIRGAFFALAKEVRDVCGLT